ncbi:MAG: glycosyltransferase family 39 protein [Planctomycetota bacterium]
MGWLAVFLLALALRVASVLFLSETPLYQSPHGDGRVYLEWADRIREGGLAGLVAPGEVFYQAPLYPHLLALFRSVVGESLVALRVGQACLGAGTVVLVGLATARFVGRRAGLWAGLLVAVYAPSIWLDGLVQKSALAAFLFALAMLLAPRTDRRGRFALGVVVGLLMLTRGEARLIAVALAGWLYFRLATTPRIDRLLAYALGLAVALTPVLLRNGLAAGEWVLTTSQAGTNLYIGNHQGATGTYAPLVPGRGDARSEADDARSIAESDAGRALSSREVSAYWRTRAVGDMAADPVAAAVRLGTKAALALHVREIADTDDLGHAGDSSPVLRFGPGFGALFALAALGLVLARRDERSALRLPLLLAITQWSALVLFFVFARYRLPLALALAPMAGLALASLPRVRGRVVVSVVAASAALAFSHLPLPAADADRNRAAALVNEGIALVETSRFTDARALAEEAVALAPDLFDAHRLLALTYLRDDASREALPHLERAHELAPRDWQVRAWLGIALGETGEARRAYAYLLGAARERPEALPIASNAIGLALRFDERRAAIDLLRLRLAVEPIRGARAFRLQLAWLLATAQEDALRDGEEAVRVLATLPAEPDLLGVLAAAQAEAGRFDEALQAIDAAIEASGAGRPDMRRQREAYAARRAWRE